MDNEALFKLDDEMSGAIGVMLDDEKSEPTLWTVLNVYDDWTLLCESNLGFRKCNFSDFWQLI